MNPYGFDWGPLEVTRICHIEGRGFVLEIRTDHQTMQVYVTEKGRKIRAQSAQKAQRPRAEYRALLNGEERA